MKRESTICCLLSIPMAAMAALWIATFLNPELAYYGPLKLASLLLFLGSWFGGMAGMSYFLLSRKSWPVIGCLTANVVGGVINVCGFIWAMNSMWLNLGAAAGAHGAASGSAPAPGAVFRALAENNGRAGMFQAFVPVSRATAERGARSATPGGGCAPRRGSGAHILSAGQGFAPGAR
jgi:hypothetical protein